MSKTPEEALRALTRPGAAPVSVRQMVVSAVNDDGTVNLVLGSTFVDAVPALASYGPRAEGDKVAAVQTAAGWLVLGRAGAETDASVGWGQVTGKPQVVALDFGEAGPPAGFTKVAALYVKDGALYADTSTAGGGGGGSSPTRVPSPRTVQPVSDAAYRFGTRDDSKDGPIQGAWSTSSYPAYSGAWFYGGAIKDACDAGTVDFIELRVGRASAYHGIPRGVPTRLYLHGAATRGAKAPALFNPHTGPFLELGQVRTFRLPGDWVTALANGTAKGVGCSAPKGSDYLIYGPSCGQVTVHYK